jgi:hypothetical protein
MIAYVVASVVDASVLFVRIRCKLCRRKCEQLCGLNLAGRAVTAANQSILTGCGRTITLSRNLKAEAIPSSIGKCCAPNAIEKRVH